MDQLVYLAVIAGAAVLFFLPVIVAALRGTEPLWLVVVMLLAFWPAAWIAVFVLPGRPSPARRGPERPYWDDPRHLYGGVLPADPATASLRQDRARARVSA